MELNVFQKIRLEYEGLQNRQIRIFCLLVFRLQITCISNREYRILPYQFFYEPQIIIFSVTTNSIDREWACWQLWHECYDVNAVVNRSTYVADAVECDEETSIFWGLQSDLQKMKCLNFQSFLSSFFYICQRFLWFSIRQWVAF